MKLGDIFAACFKYISLLLNFEFEKCNLELNLKQVFKL